MALIKTVLANKFHWLGIMMLVLLISLSPWLISSTGQAPDVAVQTLDGRTLAFHQLRNRPVLVTFWATSCPSCVAEIPHLVELYNRYHSRGLEIIAIAMAYDPPNRVVELTELRRLPYTVALDLDGAAARAFDNVRLTPTSFLISPAGRIVHRQLGKLDMTHIEDTLDRML